MITALQAFVLSHIDTVRIFAKPIELNEIVYLASKALSLWSESKAER